jgi:hypothetical protein
MNASSPCCKELLAARAPYRDAIANRNRWCQFETSSGAAHAQFPCARLTLCGSFSFTSQAAVNRSSFERAALAVNSLWGYSCALRMHTSPRAVRPPGLRCRQVDGISVRDTQSEGATQDDSDRLYRFN